MALLPDPELRKRVLALALPLMAANLSQTMISVVDTAMVGRLGADAKDALAAIGAAGILYLILFLVCSATFMGVQTITARRFGAERYEDCGRVLFCGLVLGGLLGIVFGGLVQLFAADLTQLLYPSTEAPRIPILAAEYLSIRGGGIAVVTLLWAFKGFYYGIGSTKIDMMLTVLMNLLNIGLNSVLIHGNLGFPALGLAGAAWASVLATGTAMLAYLVYSLRPAIRARYRPFRLANWNLEATLGILRLSGPRALQALGFGGSIFFFKLISDRCGDVALAASTVVWRFFGIPVLLALGLGAAAGTLVGQSLGAKRPDLAEAYAWTAVRIGILINGCLALIILLIPETILSLFTDREDVRAMGVAPIRVMAIFQVVDTVGIILARSLSAAGSVVFVMLAEILTSFGVMLPIAAVMTHYYPDQLGIVWLAWAAYMCTWCGTMTLRFRSGHWKSIEL